ncbi:hypothetical protein [Nocardia wallacei]|uniref:hypothetical protein n=1 Tax=Nocardia wallacei TaxID=480035 RepID=UPI0024566A20|nr:hypothetical protein [Nocardia wallacei]
MTGETTPLNPQQAVAGFLVGVDLPTHQIIQRAEKTQDGSRIMQGQLAYNSTDPDYIPDVEHWNQKDLSHQEIYNRVQEMQPDAMHTSAKKWGEISAGLGGAIFGLNLSIQKALSDGIQGQFGDAALTAARKFVDQATDVQEVIRVVGLRIETAAYGAEAVKRSVPPPAASSPGSTTGSLADVLETVGAQSPGAAVTNGTGEEELYQQAILAMQTNYDPTYHPAGQGVPTFAPVDSPGDDGNGPPNNGWTPGTGGPSAAGTDGNTGSADGQSGTGEQQAQADPADTATASDSSNAAGSQGSQAANSNQQGAGATSPNGNQTTAAGFGSGSGGRGGGSGSSGGFGSGGSGRPGGSAGGAGRSGTGVPGAGNPAAAAALGAGKAGTAVPGMPGMGGGAPGRKGEDDEKERKTPDYLVMDREEELLGTRERTVPQAIGADIPAAQTQPDNGGGQKR